MRKGADKIDEIPLDYLAYLLYTLNVVRKWTTRDNKGVRDGA